MPGDAYNMQECDKYDGHVPSPSRSMQIDGVPV